MWVWRDAPGTQLKSQTLRHYLVKPAAMRDPAAGVTLVLYAALVAASFAILLAEGHLSEWNVVLKMPGAFAIGF